MKNETTYSLLNALDNPEDLRRLTPEQLPEVWYWEWVKSLMVSEYWMPKSSGEPNRA